MPGVPEFYLKDLWFVIIPALIFGAGFFVLLLGIFTASRDLPKEDLPQSHKEIPRGRIPVLM